MAKFETEKLRNLGIVGQGDAGKTSLIEAMLFNTGMTDRLGKVDDGVRINEVHKAVDDVDRQEDRMLRSMAAAHLPNQAFYGDWVFRASRSTLSA